MPSDRKPYSIPGGAEPETFSRAEQGRREVCRLAQQYFDDRDRYVREYLGEMVVLGHGRVLMHAPVGEFSIPAFFAALGAEGLRMDKVFCKQVQEEEAELRAPYAL